MLYYKNNFDITHYINTYHAIYDNSILMIYI